MYREGVHIVYSELHNTVSQRRAVREKCSGRKSQLSVHSKVVILMRVPSFEVISLLIKTNCQFTGIAGIFSQLPTIVDNAAEVTWLLLGQYGQLMSGPYRTIGMPP